MALVRAFSMIVKADESFAALVNIIITSYLPVEHPAETHGVVADVDVLLHLAHALGHDLTHLQRHQLAQRLQVPPQLLPNLPGNICTRTENICVAAPV